jgi:uncharacterized protein (TIGR02246 family)
VTRGNVIKGRAIQGLILAGLVVIFGSASAADRNSSFDNFLKTYTTVWNSHDGGALASLFTADADLVMGSLPMIRGRNAIGEWWNGYFSRLDADRKGQFEVQSLRELAPDVLLVNLTSKTSGVGEHGERLEVRLARGTWVLVQNKGTWQISAMRGLPAEGEGRSLPGVDR